ncbi:MAG: response regulator [Verrucomicrobiae bacterium]|nr:response regulator [Verrucomicrobiae bacterium]
MNILLVEDNPADVQLTREALREAEMQHDVIVVVNGERAIDLLRKRDGFESSPTPDLVLLDLNLPGMSGLDVLREIKSDELLMALPVIVVSNSAALEDVDAVYRCHGNSFLAKPGNFDEFIHMVRSICEFWLKRASLPNRL